MDQEGLEGLDSFTLARTARAAQAFDNPDYVEVVIHSPQNALQVRKD